MYVAAFRHYSAAMVRAGGWDSVNNTTKRKLLTVVIGRLSFLAVGVVAGIAIGVPVSNAVILATWLGLGVSLFGVLYIQAPLGIAFRKLSPLKHSMLYAGLILLLYCTGVAFLLLFVSLPEMAQAIIARISITLPVVFLISVTILRIVSFIGAKNLLHLLTGRYQRPMQENRVFLFLDLKNSTTITETLGTVRAREFISDFIFDISKAITDNRGDVYKFMGDGIVSVWRHTDASSVADAVSAVVDARKALAHRAKHYRDAFGFEPVAFGEETARAIRSRSGCSGWERPEGQLLPGNEFRAATGIFHVGDGRQKDGSGDDRQEGKRPVGPNQPIDRPARTGPAKATGIVGDETDAGGRHDIGLTGCVDHAAETESINGHHRFTDNGATDTGGPKRWCLQTS